MVHLKRINELFIIILMIEFILIFSTIILNKKLINHATHSSYEKRTVRRYRPQ
jgi:hypothetical protein